MYLGVLRYELKTLLLLLIDSLSLGITEPYFEFGVLNAGCLKSYVKARCLCKTSDIHASISTSDLQIDLTNYDDLYTDKYTLSF